MSVRAMEDPSTPGGAPTLGALLEEFGGAALDARSGAALSPSDPRLSATPADAHQDSRRVAPGDLFFGLPGHRVDGAGFVPEVLERGALAALVPEGAEVAPAAPGPGAAGASGAGAVGSGLAVSESAASELPASGILWRHARAADLVGPVSSRVHGSPDVALDLVGITGTNGKTSVAHLAGELLEAAGRRPAVLGTAGHRLAGPAGPVQVAATHTTPEVTELVRLMARHRSAGGDACLMEVSSHALVQGRVQGLELEVGAFTNLTREHLDYHGTMEAYGRAKARLWDHVRPGGTAVIAGHDDGARRMREAAEARGLRVLSVDVERAADLWARDLEPVEGGTGLVLEGLVEEPAQVLLPLRGQHNVENALVAAGIAVSLGADRRAVLRALGGVTAPPGRLEPVPLPDGLADRGFEVLVDYAHSPDALDRVLASLRGRLDRAGRGRLLCVFGCGGDRDRGKRAEMGAAAARWSDLAVVTSDNPRSEDPAAIAREVMRGATEAAGVPGAEPPVVELDRRAAIAAALGRARGGDVVLIAGKGHETTQTVAGESRPFDDRVVAAEVLAGLDVAVDAEVDAEVDPEMDTEVDTAAAGQGGAR